jgi:sugar phosphate isomerase/epimerase
MEKIKFSMFTKPWKDMPIGQLGETVSRLGFDGIEFPLRPGFQVEPDQAEKGLPRLVEQLASYNLRVFSVASSTDEHIFSACAEAGVPLIRIMIEIREDGYLPSIERARRHLESLLPLCERYGVQVGIQQHRGKYVFDSPGLYELIRSLDERYITAIWDAAHDALTGQEPEIGLDLLWTRLGMVNLKNAYYRRVNGPEAGQAEWKCHFTTGRHGMASWEKAARHLISQNYSGVICLTAEYEDQKNTLAYIREDLAYAKSLFAR